VSSTQVGSIHYDVSLDTAKFDAAQRNITGKLDQLSGSFGEVADGIGGAIKAMALMAVAGSVGFGAMAKASFDQVRQVENASFALKAYEKDAGKVNAVLSDLVKFARSDMGVLFQREDLFATAQTLKIFGSETAKLTERTQILAKASSVAGADMKELGMIVGRAGAAGKLTAVDFDMLLDRGIGLDRSMRGASVTAEQLFQAINKAVPDEILSGRAKTIDGVMIRLKSAFRDLGGAILGVDKDTSTFIAGGLGDRFIGILDRLRTVLRDPALAETFKKMGQSVADFADRAVPLLISGFNWIMQNMSTVVAAFQSLIVVYGVAKIAAIGFAIAANANPISLIVMAIATLIGVLTFLQLKFDWIGKTIAFLNPILQPVINAFRMLGIELMVALAPAIDWVKRNWDSIVVVLKVLGVVLLATVGVIAGVFLVTMYALIKVTIWTIEIIRGLYNAIKWLADGFAAGWRMMANAMNNANGTMRNIFNALIGAARGFLPMFVTIGADIINGMIRGIGGGANGVINKVKEIAKNSLNEVKKFFGIKSPSTVMAKQGVFIMQGLGMGITDGAKNVVRQANRTMQTLGQSLSGTSQMDMMVNASMNNSSASMMESLAARQNAPVNTYIYGDTILNGETDQQAYMDRLAKNFVLVSRGSAT
jgi:hypothetical protein